MSHANARLTPAGRLILVERIEAGTTQAEVARQLHLSRGTVAKWWHRYRTEGEAGLRDRSSRPHRSPRRTSPKPEERICRLRRNTKRGPGYLSVRTGVPQATIWQVLKRHGLNRLSWMDRPTGQVIRRCERSSPGELVHLDVKNVGRVPPGRGWRVHGRGSPKAKRRRRKRRGYTFVHVAVDVYSRVAYVEALDDEKADTLLGFWRRAQDRFWANYLAVDEVLTVNGANFASTKFAELLAERRIEPSLGTTAGAAFGVLDVRHPGRSAHHQHLDAGLYAMSFEWLDLNEGLPLPAGAEIGTVDLVATTRAQALAAATAGRHPDACRRNPDGRWTLRGDELSSSGYSSPESTARWVNAQEAAWVPWSL